MLDWYLKQIGVSDELMLHLDQAELVLQHEVVLWVGLVVLIPVGYFIFYRQQQNLNTVPRRFRVALSLTRILILALLVGVLSGPYLRVDLKNEKKPIVALLFDRSQSMQLPAAPFGSEEELLRVAKAAGYLAPDDKVAAETREALNGIGRAELAHKVVRGARETLIASLDEDYEVRFYSFARRPAPLVFDTSESTPETPPAGTGTATYLGQAVLDVLEEAAGRQVSGILLFSDGQNTGGSSPAEAARAAADAGTPIYTIPLGSTQQMPDVSIVDVYTSGLVAVGDTVRVDATLESTANFDKRPVRVELRDGEKILDTRQVVLKSAEQQHVELTFEAAESGAHYLTVEVPPLDEESDDLKRNNTDTAFVRISEEKLRVLYIEGVARWDFRFLKNAIRRDHGLAGRTEDQPDIVLEAEWKRRPAQEQAEMLPGSLDELAEYYTVILGDASPKIITPKFTSLLIDAVRERGVGLIVAAGPLSMPHLFGEEFQELLPVRLQPRAAGMEAGVSKPFRLEISPDGVIHDAMRLYDDPGRNQKVWGRMPPYYWCAAATRPSPAATALAWNPSVENRFGKLPLIAYQYAGEGKVLFVGTDSTWLWRQNVGDRFFYKFWGQSIRFVARSDESAGKKSWIEVRPVRAQPGEQAKIELMAFNEAGSPLAEGKLTVTVTGPRSTTAVEMVADKSKQGRYTGRFTPEETGEYRLTFRADDAGEPCEAKLRVRTAPEEFRYPSLNRPTLELLAGTSGGEVVALADLDGIPEKLKGETTTTELHREATIWDNWITLALLVFLYCVDVGIRRLIGLS